MKPALLLASILLLWTDCPALAQDADLLRPSREDVAAGLRTGDLVRVRWTGGAQIQGVLTEYEWPELHLSLGGEPAVVLLPEIEALWVRGPAAKRGALIGGLAGVVVGSAMGLFVGEVICDNPDCQASTPGAIATFGAVGAAVGAGSGALVGLVVPRWHARFP
jgi:hypothetical protein